MSTRWSWNIDGLDVDNAVWESLLAEAKTNTPSYVTIMDDKNRAKQWQSAIPTCQVIYRTYDSMDNDYHAKVTPQVAAANLERDHSDMRGFWHYYRLNEPTPGWTRYQDWIIRFAQEAKARGFKVTAGGLALGKMWQTPDYIAQGNADPFLDYAIANEDTFLVDDHQYVTGFSWSPQIQSYPSALFDRNLILANEHIPVLVDTYAGYQGFTNWGMYRICWLANARALERHGKRLNFVINEGVFDWNTHIFQTPHEISTLPNGLKVNTLAELRKYAEDKYDRQVWGVLAHWLYLSWVVTGNMQKVSESEFTDIVIRDFKFVERTQPDNCKGIMPFGVNKDWELPEGHDYSPIIRSLLPKMKQLAKGTTPTPNPVPTPTPPVLVSRRVRATVDGLRIRANAALSSTVIGILPRDWITAQISLELDDNAVDIYSWRLIEVTLNNSVVRGYVANELLDIEPVPDEIVLSPIERELVTAYRTGSVDAILAIIDNDNVVQLLDSERELLAAFDDRDLRKIFEYMIAILPE